MDSLDDSDSEEDSDDDFPDIEVLANGDSGDGTRYRYLPPQFSSRFLKCITSVLV
jgi:hypothetical protein